MHHLRKLALATLAVAATATTTASASTHAAATGPVNCSAQAHAFFLGLGGGDSLLAPAQADCILGQQIQAGTGVLRQGFNWADIERTPGVYNFNYFDRWVATAARHNMRILPVLSAPPAFQAKVVGPYMSPPRSNAAFARFVTVLVQRYGPRGSFWALNPGVPKRPIRSWQIWNEPNLPQYWAGKPNAKQYVKLLKAAYKAIKHADRHGEVVTAGMPESTFKGSIRASKYMPQLFKAHAARYFDTLAVNPYAATAKGVLASVAKTRKMMVHYKDRGDHMWVTEVGWATGGPRNKVNIGSRAQARQLKLLLKGAYKARRKLKLRGLVYYGWKDKPPYAPTFKDMWGLHTGLLTVAGVPKLAFRILAQLGPTLR